MLFANTAKNLISRRCFSHDAGRVLVNAPFKTKPLAKQDATVGLQVRFAKNTILSTACGCIVTMETS